MKIALREINNGGYRGRRCCNYINERYCTTDSNCYLGRVQILTACRLDFVKLARKGGGLSTGLRKLSTTPRKM